MKIKFDIWKTERDQAETIGNLKILTGGTEDRPSVKIWRGRAAKPFANYWFRTLERRNHFISNTIKRERERLEEKERYKKERQGTPELCAKTVKEGMIFSCSWGYDQTNVDFYQVIKVKGSCATLQKIKQERIEETGPMSETVKAVKNSFSGPKILKRIQFHKESPYFSMSSYSNAYEWVGKPEYQSHYA